MILAGLSVEPLSTTTIRRRRSAIACERPAGFDAPSSGLSRAARRSAMSSAFFAIPDARIRRLRAGKPLGLDAFDKNGRGSAVRTGHRWRETDSNPRSLLETISFSNAAVPQQFNSTSRNRPRVLAYEALAAAGITGLTSNSQPVLPEPPVYCW